MGGDVPTLADAQAALSALADAVETVEPVEA